MTETGNVVHLEFSPDASATEPHSVNIVSDVARVLGLPRQSFEAFGAKTADRGELLVARVPMYGPDKDVCSNCDFAVDLPQFREGMNEKNKRVGLFVPVDVESEILAWPIPGEKILVIEGVTNAIALHSIGFRVIGIPRLKLLKRFAPLFFGCEVTVLLSESQSKKRNVEQIAGAIVGTAASVSIATMPSGCDGNHNLLAANDGSAQIRHAIEDACRWEPVGDELASGTNKIEWMNIRKNEGRTEIANANRFVVAFGKDVKFCHEWDKWLYWDGKRWKSDDSGELVRMAISVAEDLWCEVLEEDRSKESIDFAQKTSKASGINAMLKLAASMCPVRVVELDSNHWLLNCLNGTVDLHSGQLREHRREDYITKLDPTNFNPDASSYDWDRFLEALFVNQPLIDFVQRLCGYFLTGDVSEQILVVVHGSGSNGKSTFLNAVQKSLGTDYSGTAPQSLLMEKKTESHPTELAGLFGQRIVIAQETNQGARLAESTVKILTGGDVISARRMREDFWTFEPTHKLVLCTNHKPKVRGTDHAIWRRLVLIPFNQKFWNPANGETGPEELRQDKSLGQNLAAEREGILAWMVRGCLEWQRIGLDTPNEVKAATAEYRSESDAVGRFVADCCLTNQGMRAKFSEIYDTLTKWCVDRGDSPPSKKVVGEWLQCSGFEERQSNGRWYLGIAIKSELSE